MEKELLLRFLKCETTHEEEALLADWLEADPEHQKELDRMQLVLEGLALCSPQLQDLEEQKPNRRISILTRFVRIAVAASIIIVIAAGFGYNYFSNELNSLSNQRTMVEVPAGQRICMTLSDGTQVWLNAGTKLEYPSVFTGKERRVKVSGEAMFDVKHDASLPFIVETYAYNIEVLGTVFNVEADKSINRFSAALMSGSIKLTSHLTSEPPIIMKVNEVVDLVGNRLKIKEIDDFDDYLWTEGIISIYDMTFTELMSKFERAFDVKIEIKRQKMPDVNYGRGKIRVSDGIDHALRMLQMASDFTYEKDPETGIITIL